MFVTVISVGGKFFGAWLGARFTDLAAVNRLPVAIAHIPGGSMEIVIGILALQYRLITESVFVAIVFGAIASSAVLGPWLKSSISRRKERSIIEFFSSKEAIANLRSSDRDNVIHELCASAYEQGNMPNVENLYSAVLKRENSLGTAMEDGTAFPHARIPMLVRPIVVFGRSLSGIEWNSPDGQPSHFIFLILTPKEDDEIQIQILRIIARAMSKHETREAIMHASGHDELWKVLQNVFSSHQIVRK